jgi:hypothetical protein
VALGISALQYCNKNNQQSEITQQTLNCNKIISSQKSISRPQLQQNNQHQRSVSRNMPRAATAVMLACLAPGAAPFVVPTARRQRAPRINVGPGELWGGYLAALDADPLPVKMATATFVIGAGDAAAQAIERAPFDVARLGRWGFFGLVLQAPWNHAWQNILEGWLPSTPSPWTAVTFEKVALDQGLQAPAFTALVFFFFAALEGDGIQGGVESCKKDLGATLLKNWLVFIPATFANLAFVPLELRVLFINVVFFFWVIFLSTLINDDADPASD